MLKETFLICALALPAAMFTEEPITTYSNRSVFRFLLHTLHKEYSDDYKHRYPIILLVDDNANLVDSLRASSISAWAMSQFASMSQWQFQGDLVTSPIQKESIDIGYLSSPPRRMNELLPVVQMIRKGGFAIVNMDEEGTPGYVIKQMKYGLQIYTFDAWMRWKGWEKLPFKMGDHSIFRKSIRGAS